MNIETMKVLLNIILIFLFLLNSSDAQVLHLDKPYYFSGENIFYALHLPPKFENKTSAAISFHSKDGTTIIHHQLSEEGILYGFIKIPFSLTSDQYILQVHLFEQNTLNPFLLYDINIPVYNDNEISTLKSLDFIPPTSEKDKIDNHLLCNSVPQNSIFNTTCTLKDIPEGTFSIAIKEANIPEMILDRGYLQSENTSSFSDQIPLFGKRKYEENNLINNPLILSILPEDLKFSGTLADQDGKFALPIPEVYGKHKIQFYDHLNLPFEIEKYQIPGPLSSEFSELKVSESILQQLMDFQKRKTIYQLYDQLVQNVPIQRDFQISQKIKPDYDLWVADYAVKGSLGDLFVEVFTPLKFKKDRNDKYSAFITYEQGRLTKIYDKKTLFIINGQLTTDDNFVGALPIHQVESMRIYSEYDKLELNFGKGALRGVVEIDMKDPSYVIPESVKLPQFDITGLQIPAQYPLNFISDNENMPQLSTLLYWNPKFINKEENDFSFMIPNSQGNYIIEVVGIDDEGNSFQLFKSLRIQEN